MPSHYLRPKIYKRKGANNKGWARLANHSWRAESLSWLSFLFLLVLSIVWAGSFLLGDRNSVKSRPARQGEVKTSPKIDHKSRFNLGHTIYYPRKRPRKGEPSESLVFYLAIFSLVLLFRGVFYFVWLIFFFFPTSLDSLLSFAFTFAWASLRACLPIF